MVKIMEKTKITITATVNAPILKVWNFWISPEHIVKWNAASDDSGIDHALKTILE